MRESELEKALTAAQKRYDELMALMATEELYADTKRFDEAMQEYTALKKKLPLIEEEWLELSEEIEQEVAHASA